MSWQRFAPFAACAGLFVLLIGCEPQQGWKEQEEQQQPPAEQQEQQQQDETKQPAQEPPETSRAAEEPEGSAEGGAFETGFEEEEKPPVEVILKEFEIQMPLRLEAGPATFRVTNEGDMEHSFEIEGQGIERKLDEDSSRARRRHSRSTSSRGPIASTARWRTTRSEA